MGSFFAGIKSGTLAGIVYFGGLALFNAAVLYVFKADTLNVLTQSYQHYCTSGAAVNGTVTGSPQDCFDSIITVLIPIEALLGFFVSLVFAGVFGSFYEIFPGRSPVTKGATMGVIVGFTLLLLGLVGIYFDFDAEISVVTFFVVLTFVYGIVLGRLYKRYTRVVQFLSRDDKIMKILVDRRDCTGKARTFAARSTHEVKAEVAEGSSFKEWSVSGGVKVEDPRSFETTIEVEGDGVLKGQFTERR
jgi:hypothetical protein